jgi:hypothetical protein
VAGEHKRNVAGACVYAQRHLLNRVLPPDVKLSCRLCQLSRSASAFSVRLILHRRRKNSAAGPVHARTPPAATGALRTRMRGRRSAGACPCCAAPWSPAVRGAWRRVRLQLRRNGQRGVVHRCAAARARALPACGPARRCTARVRAAAATRAWATGYCVACNMRSWDIQRLVRRGGFISRN